MSKQLANSIDKKNKQESEKIIFVLKLWKIPRKLISFAAKTGDVVGLPLNSERLKKLTENYIVSNQKLKNALNIQKLPVSAEEGLEKTIKCFKN